MNYKITLAEVRSDKPKQWRYEQGTAPTMVEMQDEAEHRGLRGRVVAVIEHWDGNECAQKDGWVVKYA